MQVLLVLLALAVASTAVISQGSAQSDDPPEGLVAAAEEATPLDGERHPLCPPLDTIDALKRAGIGFGPCVPISDNATEAERQAKLAAAGIYSATADDEPQSTDCPGYDIRTASGGITAELPCGAVVDESASEFVQRHGATCYEVTFTVEPSESRQTRTYCDDESSEHESTR